MSSCMFAVDTIRDISEKHPCPEQNVLGSRVSGPVNLETN